MNVLMATAQSLLKMNLIENATHVSELLDLELGPYKVQGYLAHKKPPPPLGPPYGPRRRPTVGS